MSQSEQFDVLVLGSGKSGKLLAWHMAQSGLYHCQAADAYTSPTRRTITREQQRKPNSGRLAVRVWAREEVGSGRHEPRQLRLSS
jgi:choline dehydrogenase-like flavoprotein